MHSCDHRYEASALYTLHDKLTRLDISCVIILLPGYLGGTLVDASNLLSTAALLEVPLSLVSLQLCDSISAVSECKQDHGAHNT